VGDAGAENTADPSSVRARSRVGEDLVGVVELVDAGVFFNVSLAVDFAFGRPRREAKDFLASDSFLGGCPGFSLGVFVATCSCSLNWAASGCDWDGVSRTATSPTCFCASPLTDLSWALGLSVYQKAHPDGFDGAAIACGVVSTGTAGGSALGGGGG
jgi:hypothetical protein